MELGAKGRVENQVEHFVSGRGEMQGMLQATVGIQRPILELRTLLSGVRGFTEGGHLICAFEPDKQVSAFSGVRQQLTLPHYLSGVPVRGGDQELPH